jgi:CopG family transcriptional regulator, nickel-responsive regulator
VKDALVRFSVAIGGELLRRFDQYRELHRYPNRSEAVRGLMRAALIEETIAHDESEAMGVVTLIYDHHVSRIGRRLTELQHHHLDRVVTTTHVHLDEKRCLEVILLRGPARQIRDLADDLIGTKGVETGRLVLSSAQPVADRGAAPAHAHSHGHDHHHGHGHDHPQSHRRAGGRS